MNKYKRAIDSQNWQKFKEAFYKSSRSGAYDSERKVKRIVRRGVIFIIFIYLVYLLFYSSYFLITKVSLAIQDPEFNTEKFISYIHDYLNKNSSVVFKNNNYFLFSKKKLIRELNEKYLIEELKIEKNFPDTLNISFKEKIANLLWQSNEKNYLINLDGIVISEVGERLILNEKNLPKIIDESNSEISLNQNILSPSLINLIISLFQEFNNYIEDITIQYFKVTNPDATFIKIVTPEGVEIHLNDRLSLEKQLNKLKAALESEMINFDNITYINLRIKDQVIYK